MKILTITTSFPYPPDDGTRIQIYQRVRQLASNNQVTLLCVHDEEIDPALVVEMEKICRCHLIRAPRRRSRRTFSGRVWRILKSVIQGVPAYERERFSEEAAQWLRREAGERDFDVIEADGPAGVYLSPELPARRVLIFHSVDDSAGWREIRFTDNGVERLSAFVYWLVSRNYQRRLGRSVDLCVTLTEQSARDLLSLDRRIPVRPCLSNGVDLDYFDYAPSAEAPAGVCFVGKMDYSPNADAVRYFHERIFPLIKASRPDLRFWIVGSNPTTAVKALGRDPAVEVTGYVSDVRPYLRRAGIAVIPVRMGGGILNKVIEALAMGVPLVTRTPGLEGLSAIPGRDLAVADDEEGFAREVLKLARDKTLRASLARNGRDYVEQNHRWEKMVAGYENELRSLIQSPGKAD